MVESKNRQTNGTACGAGLLNKVRTHKYIIQEPFKSPEQSTAITALRISKESTSNANK